MAKFKIGEQVQIIFTSGSILDGCGREHKPRFFECADLSYLQYLHGNMGIIRKVEIDPLDNHVTYIVAVKDMKGFVREHYIKECDLTFSFKLPFDSPTIEFY